MVISDNKITADNKIDSKTAVVLINLGTPDEPTVPAIRKYLGQFLWDKRVIETPRFIWWWALNGFILRVRPEKLVPQYEKIWKDGKSPLRAITEQQGDALQKYLEVESERQGQPTPIVKIAMTYGNPSIKSVMEQLQHRGVEKIIFLPLYPQYSASTTGAVYDQIATSIQQFRNIPDFRVIKHYYDHPDYISALADSVKTSWQVQGKGEKLLFSFHGIPKSYAVKGDPYPSESRRTAVLVAEALGLKKEQWDVSFQSRFGPAEWVQPYTDETLKQWANQGIHSVNVVCPAFSADCLETLEEIAIENCEIFIDAGGKDYYFVPSLNAQPLHIEMMANLVFENTNNWF